VASDAQVDGPEAPAATTPAATAPFAEAAAGTAPAEAAGAGRLRVPLARLTVDRQPVTAGADGKQASHVSGSAGSMRWGRWPPQP
jgi:hypothetical protein